MRHDLLARASKYPTRKHVQNYADKVRSITPFTPKRDATHYVAALEFHLAKADAALTAPKDKRPRKYAKLSVRVAVLERQVAQLLRIAGVPTP